MLERLEHRARRRSIGPASPNRYRMAQRSNTAGRVFGMRPRAWRRICIRWNCPWAAARGTTDTGGHGRAFAASKAALIQLTKTMALELARYSIRVNAIAPGTIESDLNSAFVASDAGQALVRRIPQRHLGDPADLDGALLLYAATPRVT